MSHQITVNILNTVTSKVSGTAFAWNYEAIEVWVDGVSTGFTQTGSSVDVPSYTSGAVVVESKLYIISGELGKYGPKDPTNPASDVVFWDARSIRYPLIATSMKNIEAGIIESRVSTVGFLYRGDWEELATLSPSFVNKAINIYRNDALLYSGTSTGSGVSKGVFTVTLANLETVLEGECTFGDPDYMVRIDSSSTNSYYTGSSFPKRWDGKTIPMVFGPRTPWQDNEKSPIPKGQYITGVPPLVLPPVNQSVRDVGQGFILKVIPTSQTTGILCRTPSFQTLTSNKTTTAPTSAFVWSKFCGTSVVEHPYLIYGQLVSFDYTGIHRLTVQSGRFISISESTGITGYELSAEDTRSTNVTNYDFVEYDTKSHLCAKRATDSNYIDSNFTISSTTITEGSQNNKLWTVSAIGVNFYDNDFYYVCTDVTGSRSAPQVSKFILESHGLSVDSSFDTLGATLTEKATMQIGFDSNVPTVNEALAEINESLLTLIKKPLGGSTYSIQDIDVSAPATTSLTDTEIGSVKVNELNNSTYGAVQYEPLYLRASRIRDEVYRFQTSDINNIYGTDRVKTLNHVLDQAVSRFDDITDFWAKPRKNVGFILLDGTITINIGDYVQVDHEDYTGKLMVTSVSPKQLGTAIQGISL